MVDFGAALAFDRFWQQYPRKVGKMAALRVWMRLKPSADLCERIATALTWQTQQSTWTEDARFIPHPATWLHQGRWDDEPIKMLSRKERIIKKFGIEF